MALVASVGEAFRSSRLRRAVSLLFVQSTVNLSSIRTELVKPFTVILHDTTLHVIYPVYKSYYFFF